VRQGHVDRHAFLLRLELQLVLIVQLRAFKASRVLDAEGGVSEEENESPRSRGTVVSMVAVVRVAVAGVEDRFHLLGGERHALGRVGLGSLECVGRILLDPAGGDAEAHEGFEKLQALRCGDGSELPRGLEFDETRESELLHVAVALRGTPRRDLAADEPAIQPHGFFREIAGLGFSEVELHGFRDRRELRRSAADLARFDPFADLVLGRFPGGLIHRAADRFTSERTFNMDGAGAAPILAGRLPASLRVALEEGEHASSGFSGEPHVLATRPLLWLLNHSLPRG
jgi:hypothetical protein